MTSVGGGPLNGITVVSMEQAVAMPYATAIWPTSEHA